MFDFVNGKKEKKTLAIAEIFREIERTTFPKFLDFFVNCIALQKYYKNSNK